MYNVEATSHMSALKSAGEARGIKRRLRHVVRAASLYGIEAVDSSGEKSTIMSLSRTESMSQKLSETQRHNHTFLRTYDPSKILSLWAFVMLPDLTVFHNRGHLPATVLYMAATIFLIQLPTLVPDEVRVHLENSCLYNPDMDMQNILASPTRTLLAFVLGGFVIQVLTAWYLP